MLQLLRHELNNLNFKQLLFMGIVLNRASRATSLSSALFKGVHMTLDNKIAGLQKFTPDLRPREYVAVSYYFLAIS